MSEYLKISGLSGGSVAAGYVGDFEVSAISNGGFVMPQDGSGAGILTLAPVTLAISDLSPGAQGLLKAAVSGTRLPGVVEIDYTQIISSQQVTTGVLLLSGVTVVQDLVAGGGATVSLDYTALTLKSLDGGRVTSSVSYVVGSGALAPPPDATLAPAQQSGTDTYMRVAGVSGPAASGSTSGLFELAGEAFAVTSGGQSSPLVVTLNEPITLPGHQGLFSDLVSGTTISRVEIDDVKTGAGGQSLLYEKIVLSNAVVTQDTAAGDDSTTLAFAYAGATVTFIPQNQDGSLGVPVSTVLPGTLATTSVAAPPAGSEFPIFMRISGLDGGGSVSGYAGAFNVEAISNGGFAAYVAGGGGSVTLAPVTLRISDLSTGAKGLLNAAVSGAYLPGVVEIDDTTAIKGQQVTMGALLLSGVTVVQDQVAGGDATVTLNYTALTLENLSSGQVTSSLSYVVGSGGLAVAPDVSLVPAQEGATATYMQVAGVSGPASSGSTSGLFKVFGEAFAVTSGGQSTPLVVTLNEPTTEPDQLGLFKDLVSGTHIARVEIDDVKSGGGGQSLIYEKIKLSDAVVTQDTAAGDTTTLAFAYSSATVTYTPQRQDGTAGTPVTTVLPGTTATTSVALPLAASDQDVFMRVSGLDGGVTSSAYVGAFDVGMISTGGYVFSQSSSGGGDLTLAPVTLAFNDPVPGAQGLLKAAVNGTRLPGVVEIDYTAINSVGQAVTTGALLLSGVTVVQDVVAGGGSTVSLDYTALTQESLSGGRVASSVSYVVGSGTLAPPPDVTLVPAQPGGTDTYMRVAGVVGPVSSGSMSGLFRLAGEAFAVTSGGQSSPLMVTLNEPPTDPGQLGLFKDLVSGTHIASVEIDDVLVAGPGQGLIYEKIVLSNAVVTQDTAIGDTGTTLAFAYEDATVTFTPQRQDGTQGTPTVVDLVACFTPGTMIRMASGEVAVEQLRIGDHVVTTAGDHRAIRWLGHNRVDCGNHPNPTAVLPVRVRAHTFGPGRPARDLWLSPGHAVCVDVLGEVLVRIGDLVNGATIVQEPADSVEYWHVGLDSHDLLLAEGMPAESYIDVGNRVFFTDGAGLPDGTALSVDDYCRPLVLDEPTVAVLRARLLARAAGQGWTVALEPFAPRLEVDGAVLVPELVDGLARFRVPVGAREVWLTEPGFVPRDVGMNPDPRHLGLELQELRITDGLGLDRVVPVTDPRLRVGVHAMEAGGRVWTTPRALLPADLWSGCRDAFLLTVAFEPGEGRRVWRHVGVEAVMGGATQPHLRCWPPGLATRASFPKDSALGLAAACGGFRIRKHSRAQQVVGAVCEAKPVIQPNTAGSVLFGAAVTYA